MSDSLLGVIIGGLIGFIPSLVGVIINSRNAKADREHQIKMKKVEIYTIAKRDALQKFMNSLGKVSYSRGIQYGYLQDYLAAAKEACLYVSDENVSTIESVSRFVLEAYDDKEHKHQLLNDSLVQSLDFDLREELASCVSTLDGKK